jgi:sugar-specific transcriptional regulator TrmB
MEEKGAILVEEGETRRCRAVSPKELLSRLDREFKERRQSASDALARPVDRTRAPRRRSRPHLTQLPRTALPGDLGPSGKPRRIKRRRRSIK